MIIIHKVAQGSDKWHELRKDRWTGTRALRLLQGKPMLDPGDFLGNIHTRRGQALEPIAIAEFERETGYKVKRPGFVTNTVYPNAGYSPDGMVGSRILLEVKCLNGERHERIASGEIPLEYLVQIYFGMIITGCRKAKLLAFNPEYSQQLTVVEVVYDKAIGNNIRKKLKLDMKKRQLLS